jgi:hypothetical protein
MVVRLVVPVITALVMIVVGVFWMFTMLIGTNGYNSSTGGAILLGNLVLVILTIVVASAASGWLAYKLQKRAGMTLWVLAPLSVITVTVASFITLFIVGGLVIVGVVEAMR